MSRFFQILKGGMLWIGPQFWEKLEYIDIHLFAIFKKAYKDSPTVGI